MTPELMRRAALTVGALLIYRIGTYVPLPGIDPAAWAMIYKSQSGGFLDVFNAGGVCSVVRVVLARAARCQRARRSGTSEDSAIHAWTDPVADSFSGLRRRR